MGVFSMPFTYLGGLLFALFLILRFTAGNFAFDQMWTNQALENSMSAGMTQVVGDHSNDPLRSLVVVSCLSIRKSARGYRLGRSNGLTMVVRA